MTVEYSGGATGTLPSPGTLSLRTDCYSLVRLHRSMTTMTTLSTAAPISILMSLMSSMSFLGALFRNSSYTIKGVRGPPRASCVRLVVSPPTARQADCRMRCWLLQNTHSRRGRNGLPITVLSEVLYQRKGKRLIFDLSTVFAYYSITDRR